MDRTQIIYTSIKYKYKLLFFVSAIIFRFGFMEIIISKIGRKVRPFKKYTYVVAV